LHPIIRYSIYLRESEYFSKSVFLQLQYPDLNTQILCHRNTNIISSGKPKFSEFAMHFFNIRKFFAASWIAIANRIIIDHNTCIQSSTAFERRKYIALKVAQ
jgi:hypothetical protein